jgi:threonylcarbamoyladenosine tRNA methylthiotransferase MtaB
LGTIALQTLGCKLNQAETESLARQFLEAGYQFVAPEDAADVYVLNTCTVTHIADRKCRNLLRLAHRRNPEALIVAAGCYAERAAAEIGGIEGVGVVVGNRDKARLTEIVQAKTNGHGSCRSGDICKSSPFRTRALVKIQEGCSQPCSFCVVPQVRGRERSRSQNDIIDEVKARVAEGYKEVILTGTRIGSYEQEGDLVTLVERILRESEVQRLRLSSLEPCDLTTELLNLWEDSRLCPHIHLPLQSGCDAVLQKMGRAYDTADYERAAALAREAIPNLALTTDIMVGFPGEGEEEFDESYRFCERMGFAAMHVFPFSARPGTKAARMEDRVGDSEKKQRCHLMLNLAHRGSQRFREQFVGRSVNVLWEGNKDSIWFGLTENYMRVFLPAQGPLTNQILETKIVAQHDGLLQGELIN